MVTVALAGADGAGKSTMSRRLEKSLPVRAKYIYMGINREASNLALPTTLLWKRIKRARGGSIDMGGPPDPNRLQQLPKNPLKRIARELKSGLRIANLIAEEWFRQLVAWYYQFRGYVVIFDRHFYFDYYKHHIANIGINRTIADRVHGFMLNHVFPKPDFVIFLDAPAEVLFSRKGEGTLELLEQRRQEYLQIQKKVERFVTVDATQPMDEVALQICNLVMDFYSSKRGRAKRLHKSQAK
jgi:thymidylate kinase